MEAIKREKSCITGGRLEPLLCLKHCPIRMSCVNYPVSRDRFMDMDFGINPKGVIELRQLVPLDALWSRPQLLELRVF